jgi:hypothetical protein
MTTLLYTIKDILRLAPEALPFIKQASVEQELPMDSKDSVIASSLQITYLDKVAGLPSTDPFTLEKLATAAQLYGVQDKIKELSDKLIKAAQKESEDAKTNSKEAYLSKEAMFVDAPNSEIATQLYKEAGEKGVTPSHEVKLYSGNLPMNKQAALKSLSLRYNATRDNDFVKLARTIVQYQKKAVTPEMNVKIASFVAQKDREYNLDYKGFNFFKEAFYKSPEMEKAAMTVKLAGRDVPYTSIEKVGRANIAHYIGDDVAQEYDNGPAYFKQVAETLPLDLQRILSNLTTNV